MSSVYSLSDFSSKERTNKNFPYLLRHLYEYCSKKEGVFQFLVNKLYDIKISTIEFYIPQLLYVRFLNPIFNSPFFSSNILLYKSNFKNFHNPLARFLLEKCTKSFHFGLLLRMYLTSEEGHCKTSKFIELIERGIISKMIPLSDKSDTKINVKKNSSNTSIKNDIIHDNVSLEFNEDIEFNKTIEQQEILNMFGNELYFVDFLTNLAERLYYFENGIIRSNKFKEELKNFNKVTPKMIYYPLCGSIEKFEQIMGIVVNDSNMFSTKARVPLLITIEVLNRQFNCTSPYIQSKGNGSFMEEQVYKKQNKKLKENYNNERKLKNESVNDDFVMIDIVDVKELKNEMKKKQLDKLFGEKWKEKVSRIRKRSLYGRYNSYSIKSFIVKANDDIRQEHLVMQIITLFKKIFIEEDFIPVHLQPYSFIITSSSSGLVETLKDAISLSSLMKKYTPWKSLLDYFINIYGPSNSKGFKKAQENFINSMAANSVVCYLLGIKDRHNGNIMIDRYGHIIHIDFGFVLGGSPGGIGYESAPFKLTTEFIEVIAGTKTKPIDTENFKYFKKLILFCYKSAVANAHRIIDLIVLLYPMNKNYPCLKGKNTQTIINNLKERFMTGEEDVKKIEKRANEIVRDSLNNTKTKRYDQFQWMTNGIYYGY